MTVSDQAISKLRSGVSGPVLTASEAGYDAARAVFNTMIDRRPAVIVQCTSNADVQTAIRFARDNNLEIAVRGGGHSAAGNALVEGGLVIDLRRMNALTVDPKARIATVGGGATISDLDRATEKHGLATTGGRVSTTGAAGFALGGGSGYLERKFGLACDNFVSLEVVTAEGEIVTASAEENPDLFWALHGGGGNFGVVTSLRLKLYPLTSVFAGLLLFPAAEAPRVLRTYRDFMQDAPDDLGGGAVMISGPDADFVPRDLKDRPALGVIVFYTGSEEAGRKAFAPILSLGHVGDTVEEQSYADFQCASDDPPGYRIYGSADYLGSFPDAAVDAYCAAATEMVIPSPSAQVLFPGGGQMARETADWPLPWRSAPWCFHPWGMWPTADDDERGRGWVKNSRERMKPWSTGATYLNFIGNEGDDRVVAGLGRENYARLAAIKAKYDPDNIFHINQNIRPEKA